MEKTQEGLIFNIQKFSVNDGGGIRTIVFLNGCPLRCQWCANPESQQLTPQLMYRENLCISCGTCAKGCAAGVFSADGLHRERCVRCGSCEKNCPTGALQFSSHRRKLADVEREILKDRVFYEQSGGGVTLSGGEALVQHAFAAALLRRMQQAGIHTAIETTAYADWAHMQSVLAHTDLVLCDLKHMDAQKHLQFTGVSNERILENIVHTCMLGKPVILRIPLIVGVNCDEENLRRTAAFAAEHGAKEVHLLPYHRLGEVKYRRLGRTYLFDGRTPDEAELHWAASLIEGYGLPVQIGG